MNYAVKMLLIMAVVTYLIRMLPLVIFKKPINNKFIKSFLHYVPYAVLSAMTVPAIFFATGSIYSAIAGFATAIILSLLEQGLLTVAVVSCIAVWLAELFIR